MPDERPVVVLGPRFPGETDDGPRARRAVELVAMIGANAIRLAPGRYYMTPGGPIRDNDEAPTITADLTNRPRDRMTVDLNGNPTPALWWTRARNRRKQARKALAKKR